MRINFFKKNNRWTILDLKAKLKRKINFLKRIKEETTKRMRSNLKKIIN
jgi:hypothetical protein